ncbi:MAG: PolC-type DNA polymerase III [Actinomycetia bacterium]|nr:PolC-type DNA polymerase III [Actinomycetes bacterium]
MARFEEFLARHPDPAAGTARVTGVRLRLDGRGAEVAVAAAEPWSAALVQDAEAYLSEALGVPVRVVVTAEPAASGWSARLARLPGAGRVLQDARIDELPDGRLHLVLPSPGALAVFETWGGVAKLRSRWPDLPPVVVSAAEAAPPPPEEVAVRPPRPEGFFWGRGAPDGAAQPLDALGLGGAAVVEGRVFLTETRTLRDGQRLLAVGITDGRSALKLTLFGHRGQAWPAAELEEGQWVRAAGTLETDRSGEVVLRVEDLGVVPGPELSDGAPVPRVEWHCHTKMSAMDGVFDLEAAFALARQLGHPALGIVDHGVVQAYPEAARLAARYGVRALYGIEAFVADEHVRVLWGAPPSPDWWERPIVAVDLETTGLSARTQEIVEIGAVRIEGGEVVDRFERLVRPVRRPLSAVSSRITGIRDADLSDAPTWAEILPAFREFCRGAVLAAHNAAFDWGFLRPHLGAETAVVDTLALARAVLPDQRQFGLAPLAERFRIPLDRHHRALADAEAAGRLLLALLATEGGRAWLQAGSPARPAVPVTVAHPVPVLIYPRDPEGLLALYRAVSDSHLKYFHRVPRIPRAVVEANRAHWLVGAPALGGEVTDWLFRAGEPEEEAEWLRAYDFWEIVPPAALADWAEEGALGSPEAVQDLLQELVERAERADKPVIAASDAHYARPADGVFRDILARTAKGELHHPTGALHYRTTGEMVEELAFLGPERAERLAVAAPRALLDAVAADLKPVPEGLHAPSLPDAERVVSEQPWARARELYGDPLPEVVRARLEREIQAIVRHGYASVYYTAHRLVEKSLADGYLVGSRGSVGSSLVATYLNITEVNPLPPHYRCPRCRYSEFFLQGEVASGFDLPPKACPRCGAALVGEGQDIPFETFLGFEGDKVPDIDLNFSGEYQPVIHRFAEELFGTGRVFRAGTIATVAERTAFGLVKAWARETGRELRPIEVERLVRGLLGVKRTTGQHPGGLMVVPADDDIHRFTPLQRPADAADSDVVTTHFDYHAIEGRLLKLDLLGHEDPTTLRLLADWTGIDPRSVPFHDPPTMALFSGVSSLGVSAEAIGSPVGTLGLPEFGTPFVRRMLADTRPTTFGELVRISGLSHGTNVWVNNAETLIKRGQATLAEVIATRDDIMTYLIRQGLPATEAFAIMERVRKGKGISPEQERLMRAHGVPEWYCDSCQRITYMFPKAHAVAYVTMCWRIAWFKVHHPLAFYAAYFTVRVDDVLPEAFLGGPEATEAALARLERLGHQASAKERAQLSVLEVAREMFARGIRIAPVSLEESDAVRFVPLPPNRLRLPFVALPGLGRTAAHNIVEARRAGPFLSVDDLRERARLSKPVLDLLRHAGALDNLGESRQLALF